MKLSFFIPFILSFLIVACFKENSTSPNIDKKTEVQFDLQTGFADEVHIKVDDKFYFHAISTNIEYTAGPQASFVTYLSKDKHKVFIYRKKIEGPFGDVQSDSTVISIGTSEKYWVGLSIYSDSLYFLIQDSSFFYI
jgi:hypothetical protein